MTVSIEPVARDRRGRTRFWRAGLVPYAGDPCHVTPLLLDAHARWSPEHPFFRHAETQHLVAVHGGRDVGRIAATVDHRHDDVHGPGTGHVGWFESIRDPLVSGALLDAASDWLRERGRTRVRGPLSYSTNGLTGLLVEDAEPGPPVIDMPYNPAWYAELLRDWGLEPARDVLALWLDVPDDLERLRRVAARLEDRGAYRVRTIRTDRAGFAADVEHVLHIYNAAWERNWGFVPLTPDEIRHEARSMRAVLEPSLALFVEHDGVPVAFSLTLPDVHQALARIRGRLWPWSIVRLLLARRRIDRGRVITLGVLPEHRRAGLETVLILRSADAARALRWRGAECSWVLEDNELMLSAIRRVGGRVYRRYRVYERSLPT